MRMTTCPTSNAPLGRPFPVRSHVGTCVPYLRASRGRTSAACRIPGQGGIADSLGVYGDGPETWRAPAWVSPLGPVRTSALFGLAPPFAGTGGIRHFCRKEDGSHQLLGLEGGAVLVPIMACLLLTIFAEPVLRYTSALQRICSPHDPTSMPCWTLARGPALRP